MAFYLCNTGGDIVKKVIAEDLQTPVSGKDASKINPIDIDLHETDIPASLLPRLTEKNFIYTIKGWSGSGPGYGSSAASQSFSGEGRYYAPQISYNPATGVLTVRSALSQMGTSGWQHTTSWGNVVSRPTTFYVCYAGKE